MAEMIKRMVEAGASAAVIAIATEAYDHLSGSLPEPSGKVTAIDREIWRKVERARRKGTGKKPNKIKANAEANDAAIASIEPSFDLPEASGSAEPKRCDLTSLPFSLAEEVAVKEGSKKVETTRARGTRLAADAKLSDADRQFALDHGADPDAMWTEFIDYWTGVPGQRGVKLNWSGTWRNRIRDLFSRGKPNGNRAVRTDLQRALDQTREYARGGDPGGEFVSQDGQPRRGTGGH